MKWIVVALVAIATFLPSAVMAQGDYGQRLRGANGWLLPVATRILGSDETKHLNRGSVNAWDLVAPKGSAIYAMAPGVVEYAGCNNAGGYGCWVLLKHTNGYTSAYGHMIEGSIRVQRGQQVDSNTLMGQVGWTGKTSFGPHTHFEIRKGGQFQPIRNFFDITAMKQCNLCSVDGQPVAAQGVTTVAAGHQQVAQAESQGMRLVRGLLSLPIETIGFLVWILVFGFLFLLWVGNIYIRVALFSIVCSLVVVGCVAYLFMPAPVLSQPAAGQQPTGSGDAAFETALKVTLKREGKGCDTYIVRTLNGVTQWTYDRYRKEKGLPRADVCASLTESEWRYIYYNYYWLPSGANALSLNAAIPVFDHFVNAGRKITGCGDNVKCINQQRKNFYLSTADCAKRSRVCSAWLDRVEYIRTLTER